MWTMENRGRYDRSKLRYPSDLTDEEWALIEPMIPPAKRGGGKRSVDIREVVNALMYVLSTGCQWRAIPMDLPPKSTVYGYFDLWTWDRTLDRMHAALCERCREQAGREAPPPPPPFVHRPRSLTTQQFEPSTGFDKAILNNTVVTIGADREPRHSAINSIRPNGYGQFERGQTSEPIHTKV